MTRRTIARGKAVAPAAAVSVLHAARALEILRPLRRWHHQCHAASLLLVREWDGPARVARGFCRGVHGQHSWAVLGMDCFDETATILDPTLWSYDLSVTGVWVGTLAQARHVPHGAGSIWDHGRPPEPLDEPIKLTPRRPLSRTAGEFLSIVGPLDKIGWHALAISPIGGWPAAEIIDAMLNTPALAALVPIDRAGMLTDRNPDGLFLRR